MRRAKRGTEGREGGKREGMGRLKKTVINAESSEEGEKDIYRWL